MQLIPRIAAARNRHGSPFGARWHQQHLVIRENQNVIQQASPGASYSRACSGNLCVGTGSNRLVGCVLMNVPAGKSCFEIDTAGARGIRSETPLYEPRTGPPCWRDLSQSGMFNDRVASGGIMPCRRCGKLKRRPGDRIFIGNHGIGVAYAGRCLNMKSVIVAARCAGDHGPYSWFGLSRFTIERRDRAVAARGNNSPPLVKPYDDWGTIAGQELVVWRPASGTKPR